MNWYMEVLRKYADFSGRARRTEYWMFTLFNFLVYIVLMVLLAAAVFLTGQSSGNGGAIFLIVVPLWLYALATLIPGLAVSVRRLHDTGRSGWWMLLAFVPFGGIVILVFHCMDSQPGPNLYGPNPKGIQGYPQMMPPYPGTPGAYPGA
jgi:uncharacterized membrane protein YhaH (DUF805 family)